MHTDSLGRAHRTDTTPRGKRFLITPRVLAILRLLRRHPILPTPLITQALGAAPKSPQVAGALRNMKKEKTHGAPLIEMPAQLNPRTGPWCEPCWYELSALGRKMAEEDDDFEHVEHDRDWIHHRAMRSCIGASFEILAEANGVKYHHAEELLRRAPETTRQASDPLAIPLARGKLTPDGLMALETPTVRRNFLIECDRGTEQLSVIKDKIRRYDEAMGTRAVHNWYGIKNASVLFITVGQTRLENIKREIAKSRFPDRWYLKSLPTFSLGGWSAPREAIREVYELWDTVSGKASLLEPPKR